MTLTVRLTPHLEAQLDKYCQSRRIEGVELNHSTSAMLADWKEKVADLPMGLADASLIWVAQYTGALDILTIDLKDFSLYRLANGKALNPVL